MVRLTCLRSPKLSMVTAVVLDKNQNNILILKFEIKATEPSVLGRIACFVQRYHPASNTCVLSLPAPHRQEVVTDDGGSSYPEGIIFTPRSLDFWWRDGSEEILLYSGEPQNSYLCTTCQSLSEVLKEAISQWECYDQMKFLLSEDAAHLEHFWDNVIWKP